MATAKLSEAAKAFAVQRLACFDSPSEVAEAVKKEFGEQITRQSVEFFDPTKRAGKNLAAKWRGIFEEARARFIKETALIGVSHRSVRLRTLSRLAEKAEEVGDSLLLMQLLEQAAKEMGGVYSQTSRSSSRAKSPFDNGLSCGGLRDSSLGCGPERAVTGWLIMRSEPNLTRLT
jgi:hypothetical protein